MLLNNLEEISYDYAKQKLNKALSYCFENNNNEKKNGGIRDKFLFDKEIEKLLEKLKCVAEGCPENCIETIKHDILASSYQFMDYLSHTQILPEISEVVSAIYKIFAVVIGDWLSRANLPEEFVLALEEGV